MEFIALIPEELLRAGVSVIAWPDGSSKTDRCHGTIRLVPNTEAGSNGSKLILTLDDKRVFIDPTFPCLAD